ncbi:MAG: sigma-54-dependent Fis family transcriptional regulator [Nitrospirae bacterium]|jgi:DNA-binding NtrC family response regulator|nr:sigma-54-dependent Fis family transcriptional regulator [Nitrospirota bacterium]
MKPSILLVDDESAILFLFSDYLSKAGYDVKKSLCLKEAKEAIKSQQFNAVILDLILPDGNGIDWIKDLREACPDIAIIVITGIGDVPIAVEAMRRGADNFLTKPVNMTDLDIFLRKSLELQRLRRKDLTSQRLQKQTQFYFGESTIMKEVKELALMAAKHNLPVLIQGETGTGKNMLSRWIHEHSYRSSAPFVELSCSGPSGDLLASELFGHVKGAFTSAIQDKEGLIEVANGGTLFLDEIGDMDPSNQAQFLKVIEEKQYRRLGEVKVRWSDFRLICATNRDLKEETKLGRFRQDLYFRINIFPIVISPLRDRLDDVRGLVQHILTNRGSYNIEISQEVINLLKKYPWPGNVRELKNILERAIFLAGGGTISVEHFRGIEAAASPAETLQVGIRDLEQLEEEHIRDVIKRMGGNKRKAATALGISKSALYRKLKKFQNPI